MTIVELKKMIEEKTYDHKLLILKVDKNTFLVNQYIQRMSEDLSLPIQYVEDIESLNVSAKSVWGEAPVDTSSLRVIHIDELAAKHSWIINKLDVVIVTHKLESDVYNDYVVEISELEAWQIREYVHSKLVGIEGKYLDWLIALCDNNIDRLQREIEKITLFDVTQRKYIFEEFAREGVFSDLSTYDIFAITNALQIKDKTTLRIVLKEISRIDVEPIGFATTLVANFRKMIMVWMNSNPTPENTGLKSNVIYAINKLPHNYSRKALTDCYKLLTSIDSKLKTGVLPENIIIDYIIIKLLSS